MAAVPPPTAGIPPRVPMLTVAARPIPPDRGPAPPTHTVALHIMRKDLERRLLRTPTVVARHITPEVVPSLQIHLARRPTVTPTTAVHMARPIIHLLPTMAIIHPPRWRTTVQAATTAALVQLQ